MNRCRAWSIVRLRDVPEAIPVLAGWIRRATGPHHGACERGDPHAEFDGCAGRDVLPAGFVALGADRAPIGTASLKRMPALSQEFPGPWLAALVVREECRGCGIATNLVLRIEEEASRLGFPMIYAAVHAPTTLLRRRGWNVLGSQTSPLGKVPVFGKYLI